MVGQMQNAGILSSNIIDGKEKMEPRITHHLIVGQGLASGTLIEAGCGEGYGADLLRAAGAQVIAVDYDDSVVAHVRQRYPRVQTMSANLVDLPLRSATADVLVSLLVIEHLWNLSDFWSEVRRVVGPGGWIVVSTPNRVTFSPGVQRGEKPTNPFHVEEFDADQLHTMLTDAGFTQVRVLGLRHGSRLSDSDIVARQIDAILADDWPADLDEAVARVTVTDFEIDAVAADTDLDLIVVARR